MPRTPAEVNTLLSRLKQAREDMDRSGDTVARRKETVAASLEGEASNLEGQIPALRQRIAALQPEDQSGRAADAEQIRFLLDMAGQKRRLAAKERMNAARMLSLGHVAEEANDKEVCVDCHAVYDDNGDVVGAVHLRHPIEDRTEMPPGGGPPVTVPGLRSLLADDANDLDPTDNHLRLGGRRVGGH